MKRRITALALCAALLLCAGAMLETPCRGAVHLPLPMRRKACVPGDVCDGSSAQRP